MYVFHRVTHSKTSGGRNNIEIENPLLRSKEKTSYIVKREEKDKKGRFSLFELELKLGVNANDLKIKKAGGSQTSVVNNVTTSIDDNKLTNNALAQKGACHLGVLNQINGRKARKND